VFNASKLENIIGRPKISLLGCLPVHHCPNVLNIGSLAVEIL
jgi:hypothetical protein